ncbi:hypothetical protein MMC10_010933 [Thelotrema lepadinum]|nr:hypothetical protein [Thelotrema lepadinum]
MDYSLISGAKRNFEPWRIQGNSKEETDEEILDRLEREETQADTMQKLETKMLDTQREMQIADALDEIRTRNALNERINLDSVSKTTKLRAEVETDLEKERLEKEDEEVARKAFLKGKRIKLNEKEADPASSGRPELHDAIGSTISPVLAGTKSLMDEMVTEEVESTKEVEDEDLEPITT